MPDACRSTRPWRAVLALVLAPAAAAVAGPPPVPVDHPGRGVAFHADSGPLGHAGDALEPVWEIVAGEADVPWLRVFFGPGTRLHPGSEIRITSLYDGSVQNLSRETLRQWNGSSAYFNGSQVLVELLAAPRSRDNRVTLDGLWVGTVPTPAESICGSDDRVLSGDDRAGRMLGGGCTAWLINECFLSAGHCILGNSVVQFDVPLSSGSGSLNHPPASEQYSIDTGTRQWVDGGIGNDWGTFGVFANTQTGLTPLQAQGARYIVASNVPAVAGQSIRITGYGVDSTPPEHNQVQQTNAGPYREFVGTIVRHEADTTGGNSGSAVFDESTGRAIGIHSHAGCDASPPPYNQGTGINNAGLQAALRSPAGSCASQPACNDNGVCDAGEDCYNCVNDCGHAPANSGGGSAVCGNNICEIGNGEDCSCSDCNSKTNGPPSGRYCCGADADCNDPVCTANGNTCNPNPTSGGGSGYCCGDGLCESPEDASSCGADCAAQCLVNEDCDDTNECTTDACSGGVCQNTPVADDTSCDAGAGICCSGSCSTAACIVDADCDDGDVCTGDLCLNPGTCAAVCDNPPAGGPACCVPTHNKEKGPRCSDGLDNDCDGLIDGADPDC